MKKLLFVLPILALATLMLAGCSDNSLQCTEDQKNAEVCTMDYTPVCGDDNMTYGNACSACATEWVNSYVQWECNVEFCDNEQTEVCEVPEPVDG